LLIFLRFNRRQCVKSSAKFGGGPSHDLGRGSVLPPTDGRGSTQTVCHRMGPRTPIGKQHNSIFYDTKVKPKLTQQSNATHRNISTAQQKKGEEQSESRDQSSRMHGWVVLSIADLRVSPNTIHNVTLQARAVYRLGGGVTSHPSHSPLS